MQTNTLENTLNNASSGAHAAVDSLVGSAEQVARKAGPAIERVAAMAHTAVDKAAGAAAPGAEWLADKADDLGAAQKKLMSKTCNYVTAHPLQSLGMAVLAGFLISRITR